MREQLKNYLQQSGLSQGAAAEQIGVDKSTLGRYLKGTYQGDNGKLDERVSAWLGKRPKAREIRRLEIPFVATATTTKMMGFLGLAAMMGQLGIVYGGAGTGKTTVLKQYAERNPKALLIEPDTGFTTKVLLQEICRVLDLSGKGNIHDLTERVVAALQEDGPCEGFLNGRNRILLIDEAEQLPTRALETLRRIHDKTGAAVALVGMPKLLRNLKGPNAEFKQLFSRVSVKMELGEELPQADLLKIAGETLGCGDDKILQKIIKTAKGNVRKLAKLLMVVDYLLQVNPDAVLDETVVEHADSYLIH